MIASVASPTHPTERRFVSRAGLKLDHALNEFNIDVTGLTCADFGCNVGGFTDCLLQRGAAKVYAIDTGYNVLAYKLRVDPRVAVMERTNALHAPPPAQTPSAVDLIVIDLAWTPQRHAIPAALRWLDSPLPLGEGQGVRGEREDARELGATGQAEKPSPQPLSPDRGEGLRPRGADRIITLVKPHYELDEREKEALLVDGRLDAAEAERVLRRVLDQMPSWGVRPLQWTTSPITGAKSSKKAKRPLKSASPDTSEAAAGNVEYLVLARPIGAP